MNSSEDEINDAIKNALRISFENFEHKPKASFDEHIYKQLDKQSNRKLYWVSSSVVLLLVCLFFLFKPLANETVVTQKTNPTKPSKTTHNQTINNNKSIIIYDTKVTSKLPHNKTTLFESKLSHTKKGEDIPQLQDELTQGEVLDLVQDPQMNAPSEYRLSDKLNSLKPISFTLVNTLDFRNVIKFKKLELQLIALLDNQGDSLHQVPVQPQQPNTRKPSMLVNFSATSTSQNVYLLPNTQSRILEVDFPNSVSNISYKIGFGVETMGFQAMVNYSHMQFQTEYFYALEEFTAEASKASYNIKRLGASHTTESKFDFIGIAAKKNFKLNKLRSISTQLGMEYSRSVIGPKQQMLSTSLSVGRTFYTGPRSVLVIGPFFEYNFWRISTTDNNVKIRPNQIGISMGVKFGN